ncbi:hypothetical protein ACFL6S_18040 [Candidatus Poribacteria bacterium]
MKWTVRSIFFPCLLVLTLYLSTICAEAADAPKSVMDMIPYESLAYVYVSDLDVVVHTALESPEWQEIKGMEMLAEDLDKAKQGLSFIPMLVGITIDELLSTFGHRMAACLIGMGGEGPVAGLIVNTGDYKEQVEYAVSQAATLPAVAGGAMLEEKEYRDTAYTLVGNDAIKVRYGFLDNFLIAGIGGGFEKLVDFYKDGGRSIKDTENFQYMEQQVSLSSNISVYADIERAAPILKGLMAGMMGEADAEAPGGMTPAMMADLALSSTKAFAFSLGLSGHVNEMYLYLKQTEAHPITDLVLAPRSPMYSADLIPLDDGAMVGAHIGDPTELLDRGLKLAEFLGTSTQDIEMQIQQMEDAVGLDLREDLLSALTGEIAVVTMLPKEQIDVALNPMQMAMQAGKIRPVILLGVKDRDRLTETFSKISQLVNLEASTLKEESYKGATVYTKALPLDVLIPGIALMPAYSFKDDLLIMSNSAEWVRDGIDLLESPGDSEIQKRLSRSRALIYLDMAGVADFAMAQSLFEEIKPPESIRDKLSSLGSIAASFSLGPDGAGISLISTSDDDWTTKIMRGIVIGMYANVASKEHKAAEQKAAMDREAWEKEHEVQKEPEEGAE